MTDITAKPFDWNDNLSKEAIEDFEGIQKDLPYCTCQSIGMALAKLELLEKQGCKVIDPFVSSSEKPRLIDPAYEKTLNKWIGAEVLDRIRNEMHATAEKHEDGVYYLRDEWIDEIIDKYAKEDKS